MQLLEVDLAGDLEYACPGGGEVGLRAGDVAERCALDVGGRSGRVGVVEEVEAFDTDLRCNCFPDGKALEDRRVGVRGAGSVVGIAVQVAEGADGRRREGRLVEAGVVVGAVGTGYGRAAAGGGPSRRP